MAAAVSIPARRERPKTWLPLLDLPLAARQAALWHQGNVFLAVLATAAALASVKKKPFVMKKTKKGKNK